MTERNMFGYAKDEWVIWIDQKFHGLAHSLTEAVQIAREENYDYRFVEIENEWGYRAEVEDYVWLIEQNTAMRFPPLVVEEVESQGEINESI